MYKYSKIPLALLGVFVLILLANFSAMAQAVGAELRVSESLGGRKLDNGGQSSYYPAGKGRGLELSSAERHFLCATLLIIDDNFTGFDKLAYFISQKSNETLSRSIQTRASDIPCPKYDKTMSPGYIEDLTVAGIVFTKKNNNAHFNLIKKHDQLNRKKYIVIDRDGEIFSGSDRQVNDLLHAKYGDKYLQFKKLYAQENYSRGEAQQCAVLKKYGLIHSCILGDE